MKNIPLKDAFDFLTETTAIYETCTAELMFPTCYDTTGEPDNEFMYLSLDESRMVKTIHFLEKDNKTVKVSDSSMFLYDSGGNCREITILMPKQLE
jgi:hypothetical protein